MNSRDNLTAPTPSTRSPAADWATALVQRAARRSPPELAARLEEEWLADLTEQRSALSRLRFALGCCWAKQVISHDPVSFGLTAQRAASGHSAVTAFGPHDLSFVSRRTLLLLLIVAMHGVAIYGFSNGLGHKVIAALSPEIRGTLIEEQRPRDQAPEIAQPDIKDWTGIHREVVVPVPPDVIAPIEVTSEDTPSPVYRRPDPPPEVTRKVTRVIGGPGSGFPGTAEFYPSASRQLGETGVAALQVCVDSRGRLVNDPQIKESTGSARLDAGALALAKAGSGHYRSTTEDGQPVTSCYGFRVRFQLKE